MIRRPLVAPLALYAAWLGMMLVHEAGHVLHARFSGGVVERVNVPLIGFSETFYVVNPRPAFVAWGGPVWGCVIPLMLLAALTPAPRILRDAARFFAGFCLVANGAYLGVGWTVRAGDAADLLRHGTPVAMLIAFGVCTFASGLYLWHRLRLAARRSPAPRVAATPASPRTARDGESHVVSSRWSDSD
jgi:hypothetical protein